MAGNSKRKGAMRKTGTKKGAVVGSGGQKSKGLEGKGPTPRAKMRPGHPQQRKAAPAAKEQQQRRRRRTSRQAELVAGRNPVVECLRANVPTTALYVQIGVDADERVTEAVRLAADRGISVLEVSKPELDRLTNGALHQGLVPADAAVRVRAPGRPARRWRRSRRSRRCWWRWTASPTRATSAR